jgi:TolB-like protein
MNDGFGTDRVAKLGLHAVRTASVDQLSWQASRVLNHRSFSKSRGPARLLRHLADLAVSNGGRPTNQTDLARVLELPAEFDPNRSPLVRMHMSKLRRMLRNYASGDGKHDAVVLEVPRNSYSLRGYVRACGSEPLAGEQERVLAHYAGSNHSASGDRSLRQLLVVVEFDCAQTSSELSMLARLTASTLVADLIDSARFAAIGPLLRCRVRAANTTVAAAVQHCGVSLYLDGELTLGGRGLQATLRLMSTSRITPIWTDWLDDPMTSWSDSDQTVVAEHLARRLSCRLEDCLEGLEAD